ncbi:MAG: hypothetical protein AVDCRST_MAG62-564, partial [uncultured Sphingomonas sp.]
AAQPVPGRGRFLLPAGRYRYRRPAASHRGVLDRRGMVLRPFQPQVRALVAGSSHRRPAHPRLAGTRRDQPPRQVVSHGRVSVEQRCRPGDDGRSTRRPAAPHLPGSRRLHLDPPRL